MSLFPLFNGKPLEPQQKLVRIGLGGLVATQIVTTVFLYILTKKLNNSEDD